MEFFRRAKAVRLKSVHHKFLIADEDEESVKQDRNGSTINARWTIEFIEGKPNLIRLKSSKSWRYLCASEDPFLLGWTGKKIIQGSPRLRSDPSVEWEPIKEGHYVRLRARKGDFLRANGRVWPWRNSVTHDMPDSNSSHNGVLWVVDLLEFDHSVHNDYTLNSSASLPNSVLNGGGDGGHGGLGFGRVESDLSVSSVASSRLSEVTTDGGRIDPVYSASEIYGSDRHRPAASHQNTDSNAPNGSNNFNTMPPNHIKTPPESSDDDEEESYYSDSEKEEEIIAEPPPPPIPIEVQKAQQTLEEAKNLNFTSAYESGQLDKIEDAISTLLSHNYRFGPPNQQQLDLHDQIKTLRTHQDSVSAEYNEYEKFGKKRSKMNEGIQEIVGKVKQLQSFEEEHEMVVRAAKEKRDELLRKLKEVEEEIKAAEAVVEEDKAGIEQMCNLIGKKQVAYMEMEKEEKARMRKKAEADRKMEQVESNWSSIKLSLQMMERRS